MSRGWTHKDYGDINSSEIKHFQHNGIISCQKLFPNIYILLRLQRLFTWGGNFAFIPSLISKIIYLLLMIVVPTFHFTDLDVRPLYCTGGREWFCDWWVDATSYSGPLIQRELLRPEERLCDFERGCQTLGELERLEERLFKSRQLLGPILLERV